METPKGGGSEAEFLKRIDGHVRKRYQRKGGKYVCKKCNSLIKQAVVIVAIHDKCYSETTRICSGAGRRGKALIPYCPKCEGPPKRMSTCVHV